MKNYEPDDIATFYFVVVNDDEERNVRGWTDQKDLARVYLEFHNCKRFKIKEVKNEFERIIPILNESVHDEIMISNIFIRGENGKPEQVAIPMTFTELNLIRGEEVDFMTSRINYGLLNSMTPFLKSKWHNALKVLHLDDVIDQVISTKPSKFTMNLQLDELLILVRSLPEYFG